jgi:peptide/nickel transport system substrate-binding protein
MTLRDGRMTDADGKPLSFEIMLKGSENQQIAVAFQQTLPENSASTSSSAPSTPRSSFKRQIDYDFDMMFFRYTGSLSPGVEQASRWGSEVRDKPGTFNYAGVPSPAVDALLDHHASMRVSVRNSSTVRAL